MTFLNPPTFSPADGPPIFIGGFRRSGMSLLRYMLDSHPAIACGPETEVFVTDLRRTIAGIFESRRYEEYLQAYQLQPYEVYELFGARPIQAFFSRFLARQGKRRWADKTPSNCLNFRFLAACFPHAHFIHMIRDGRDCLCSLSDLPGRSGVLSRRREFATAARDWVHWVNTGRREGAACKNYLEVRYESLVSAPEVTMRTVLGFVGEPWDDAVLQHYQRQYTFEKDADAKKLAGAATPVHDKSVGQWKKRLSARQLGRFENVARDLLLDLGYQPGPSVPHVPRHPRSWLSALLPFRSTNQHEQTVTGAGAGAPF